MSLRLYRLTGEVAYQERAQAIIRQLNPHARENPWGFAHLWTVQTLALLRWISPWWATPRIPCGTALLQAAYQSYRPERRLVLKNPAACAALEKLLPWTRDYRQPGDEPVAYLCRDFTCLPAITDPGNWRPNWQISTPVALLIGEMRFALRQPGRGMAQGKVGGGWETA